MDGYHFSCDTLYVVRSVSEKNRLVKALTRRQSGKPSRGVTRKVKGCNVFMFNSLDHVHTDSAVVVIGRSDPVTRKSVIEDVARRFSGHMIALIGADLGDQNKLSIECPCPVVAVDTAELFIELFGSSGSASVWEPHRRKALDGLYAVVQERTAAGAHQEGQAIGIGNNDDDNNNNHNEHAADEEDIGGDVVDEDDEADDKVDEYLVQASAPLRQGLATAFAQVSAQQAHSAFQQMANDFPLHAAAAGSMLGIQITSDPNFRGEAGMSVVYNGSLSRHARNSAARAVRAEVERELRRRREQQLRSHQQQELEVLNAEDAHALGFDHDDHNDGQQQQQQGSERNQEQQEGERQGLPVFWTPRHERVYAKYRLFCVDRAREGFRVPLSFEEWLQRYEPSMVIDEEEEEDAAGVVDQEQADIEAAIARSLMSDLRAGDEAAAAIEREEIARAQQRILDEQRKVAARPVPVSAPAFAPAPAPASSARGVKVARSQFGRRKYDEFHERQRQAEANRAARNLAKKPESKALAAKKRSESVSIRAMPTTIEENTCIVCSEDHVNCMLFPCRHRFCQGCVDAWREAGNGNCPTCRCEIELVMAPHDGFDVAEQRHKLDAKGDNPWLYYEERAALLEADVKTLREAAEELKRQAQPQRVPGTDPAQAAAPAPAPTAAAAVATATTTVATTIEEPPTEQSAEAKESPGKKLKTNV